MKAKKIIRQHAHKGLCVFCKDPIELWENIHYSWDEQYQDYGLHEGCKQQVTMKLLAAQDLKK